MNNTHQALKNELDQAFSATENFITDYSSKMQYPVKFLRNVVSGMQRTEDRIVNRAHLETISRTIGQMDVILNELMDTLAKAKPYSANGEQ